MNIRRRERHGPELESERIDRALGVALYVEASLDVLVVRLWRRVSSLLLFSISFMCKNVVA